MNTVFKEVFISKSESKSIINKLHIMNLQNNEKSLLELTGDFANIIWSCVSQNTLKEILAFAYDPFIAVIILKELAYNLNIPPTPNELNVDFADLAILSAINLGLCKLIDIFPVTYQGENDGCLFRHVMPLKHLVEQKSSQGAKYPLGMHVDNCYLPLIPEYDRTEYSLCPSYMSLFGLRADQNIPTRIVALDEVLKLLDNKTIIQLMKPEFKVSKPASFSHQAEFYLPIIVQDNNGIHYCRFDQDFVSPCTKEAKEAFDSFISALYESQTYQVVIGAGDCLFIKNQRVMHGRDGFNPKFDGTDRWMLRVFGVHDKARIYPVDKSNSYHILA